MEGQSVRRVRPQFSLNRVTRSSAHAGAAHPEIELLPDEQEKEELLIAGKFCAALNSKAGRQLTEPVKSDKDPPDVWTTEDNVRFGIELTKVRTGAERRAIEAEYTVEIADLMSRRCVDSDGLAILVSNKSNTRYPKLQSKEGHALTELIVDRLARRLQEFRDLQSSTGEVYELLTEDSDGRAVFAYISRRKGSSGHIGFSPDHEPRPDELVDRVVEKLSKPYVNTWLLIYDPDFEIGPRPPIEIIRKTVERISASENPFAEIWYFFPYPHIDDGVLIQLWPHQQWFLESLADQTIGLPLEQFMVPIIKREKKG